MKSEKPSWMGEEEFKRDGGFNCCKTGRMPYDTIVCAVLTMVKTRFPDAFTLSSDGDMEQWEAGFKLCRLATGLKPSFREMFPVNWNRQEDMSELTDEEQAARKMALLEYEMRVIGLEKECLAERLSREAEEIDESTRKKTRQKTKVKI